MSTYFVRHGYAAHNAAVKKRGPECFSDPALRDAPLTRLGREQASKVMRQLVKMEGATPLAIYTSPLSRAIETARIIRGAMAIPIIIDDRLVETLGGNHVTNWRPEATELCAANPDICESNIYFEWDDKELKGLVEGPRESPESIESRVLDWHYYARRHYKEFEPIVAVTHFDVMKTVTGEGVGNCGIVKV